MSDHHNGEQAAYPALLSPSCSSPAISDADMSTLQSSLIRSALSMASKNVLPIETSREVNACTSAWVSVNRVRKRDNMLDLACMPSLSHRYLWRDKCVAVDEPFFPQAPCPLQKFLAGFLGKLQLLLGFIAAFPHSSYVCLQPAQFLGSVRYCWGGRSTSHTSSTSRNALRNCRLLSTNFFSMSRLRNFRARPAHSPACNSTRVGASAVDSSFWSFSSMGKVLLVVFPLLLAVEDAGDAYNSESVCNASRVAASSKLEPRTL